MDFLQKSRPSKQRLRSMVEKMHKDRAIKYLAEFPEEPSQEQAEQLLGLRPKPFPRDPRAKRKLDLAKGLLMEGLSPEDQQGVADLLASLAPRKQLTEEQVKQMMEAEQQGFGLDES